MVLAHHPKSKLSAHEKKRHGQHHKATKHYAKAYWPYLPMLLIIGLGFVVHGMWNTSSNVLSYATNMSGTGLLQETNIQRSSNGLGALALNSQLSQAAQEKANDMAARNYWSHATPEGTQPWAFISAVGYKYTTAGENLAYGFDSSSGAVAGWMNSPGHKANVLNSNYKEVGFGMANSANYQGDGEQTIVVAMYAAPVLAATSAPKPVATPSKPAAVAPVPEQAAPQPEPQPATPAPTPAATKDTVQASKDTKATTENTQPLSSQKVSRIDVLTDGNAQWAILAGSALIAIGAISLVYRHGRMWHKFLIKGEHFVIRHPVFDTVIVALVVIGVVLTSTSGFIH